MTNPATLLEQKQQLRQRIQAHEFKLAGAQNNCQQRKREYEAAYNLAPDGYQQYPDNPEWAEKRRIGLEKRAEAQQALDLAQTNVRR